MTPSPYRPIIETMFQIVDKNGVRCPFRLNEVQARLDASWHRRNIIPKARQTGVSSYVIARYLAKCLAEENRTCVIVSHEGDATRRLLQRAKFIVKNLKGGLKPQIGRASAQEIFFEKTNSKIFIGTAGSSTFGHGDTITDLHLSEASRYPDPESIVDGTFPAAEHGEITVESTGHGVGNWFHRMCSRARRGRGFKLHFIPWIDVAEYALPFTSEAERKQFHGSLSDEYEELILLHRGCSLEQLQWRRERLEIDFDGNLRKFKQSYPIDFDECFQSTGFGFFRKVRYEPTQLWKRESADLHVLDGHPSPDHAYVIGADPSGGVGDDNAVAQVFSLTTREQVAEFASDYTEPHTFGSVLASLAKRFNNAYVNVERNNHGGTTLARLIDVYPLYLIHRGSHGEQSNQEILSRLSHFGTNVTVANRGLILGTARELLSDLFTIHSPELKGELDTFVEKDGKIEADSGCMDDRVMAALHALIVIERAGIAATIKETEEKIADPNPWGFDTLFPGHAESMGFRSPERDDEYLFGVPRMYH